jgi:hypothetical protein
MSYPFNSGFASRALSGRAFWHSGGVRGEQFVNLDAKALGDFIERDQFGVPLNPEFV